MFNINLNLVSLIEYDDSDSDYNDDENHQINDLGFEDFRQDIARTYNITY